MNFKNQINPLRDKINFLFFFIFLFLSFYMMFVSYPHEDALILFRYVENFSNNYEIAFNLGGEKTEGATDFLWFYILSIFNLFGVNVVITSILINSFSLLVIFKSLKKYLIKSKDLVYYPFFIFFLLNMGSICLSSLYGFSTLFFLCLGLLCYISILNKSYINWTIFSILFCLTRPEGVLIFIPTVFVFFYQTQQKEKLKFFNSFLIICFVGLIYFLWRFYYFGNLLPLPLTVKKIGGEASLMRVLGIGLQILNIFILSLLLLCIYCFIKYYKKILRNKKFKNSFFIIYLFWIIYFVILSTGYLSQNIFDRFYATFHFFIFLNSLYLFHFLNLKEKKIAIIFLLLASINSSNLISKFLGKENLIRKSTLNTVVANINPPKSSFNLVNIGKTLKDKTLKIVLTEAGAIPYISKKSKIFDVVGLNNNTFSKRPVNCSDLNNISPDIIEIDISGLEQFDINRFRKTDPVDFCGFYNKEQLFEEYLNKNKVELIKQYKKNKFNNEKNATVNVGPNNIIYCLINSKKYSLVFNNKIKPDHLFFLKNQEYKSIENSCNNSRSGYLIDLINNKI